jgi:hypothetical protein
MIAKKPTVARIGTGNKGKGPSRSKSPPSSSSRTAALMAPLVSGTKTTAIAKAITAA